MDPAVVKQPNVYSDEPVVYTDFGNVALQMPMAQPAQMMPSQAVSVVTTQPTTTTTIINMNPLYPRGVPRAWTTPLCGCFENVAGCIAGLFCFPCYECHVSSKMDEGCCTPCCVRNATLVMRVQVRGRHNIQGSLINDACTTCWCAQCTLCQLSREIDYIKSGRAAP